MRILIFVFGLLFIFHDTVAQIPETDIYLLDCKIKKGKISVGKFENITNRAGYENQPYFMPDDKSLLFTAYSQNADVVLYNFSEKRFIRKTNTDEDEYSPMLMPGNQSFSVVRVEKDSAQRLWSFPIYGGKPSVLLMNLKDIGYYEWLDYNELSNSVSTNSNKPNRIALYRLGKPNTLQVYNLSNGVTDTIAKNPGRNFHRFNNKYLIYTILNPNGSAKLYKYDINTGTNTDMDINLPDSSEDFVITNGGILISGSKGKLFQYNIEKKLGWELIRDFNGTELAKFYRIAISPNQKKIALVSYKGKRP
jgi:hypothetical protein